MRSGKQLWKCLLRGTGGRRPKPGSPFENGTLLVRRRREIFRQEIAEYLLDVVAFSQEGSAGVPPPAPWIVNLWRTVQATGVLWAAGGLEDQPYYLWGDLMEVASMIKDVEATEEGN
jgi:hypothetical protein